MVEAPERIWLSAPDEVWFEDSEGRTEYTRSDIAERQIAELRAKLAAVREVAEAENARLRALPLKDEVERLTYGQKLIAEAIEHHFGERTEDYDEDADDTTNRDAWEAFDALLSRLRAGEQEGWSPIETAPTNGTAVLLCFDHHPVSIGRFEYGTWVYAFCMTEGGDSPTGWMPLPAAPSVSEGGSRNG